MKMDFLKRVMLLSGVACMVACNGKNKDNEEDNEESESSKNKELENFVKANKDFFKNIAETYKDYNLTLSKQLSKEIIKNGKKQTINVYYEVNNIKYNVLVLEKENN